MLYSTRGYPKGHIFFEEGSPGTLASIIKSGYVEITKREGDQKQVLAVLGPGEIFGEMALLGTHTRTATARAIEPTEIINVSRAHLLSRLQKADPILKRLTLSLVKRLIPILDQYATNHLFAC